MNDREDIKAFLADVKRLIMAGNWTFIKRQKNLAGLAALGLTIAQAKLEALSLSYLDYDRGPLPDNDVTGDVVWEFIKDRNDGSPPIYIKETYFRRGFEPLLKFS